MKIGESCAVSNYEISNKTYKDLCLISAEHILYERQEDGFILTINFIVVYLKNQNLEYHKKKSN